MKTRERILQTSLILFNELGEPNVTTLDIANELDISPGNLYYHFRGKEKLIPELFDRFEEGITSVLKAPIENALSVQDYWFYLYVLFEEIYNNRFIYRDLSDLLQRFDSIRRRFRRILALKVKTARTICETLAERGILEISAEETEQLADGIAMTVTYWLNYQDLRAEQTPANVVMHRGVYRVMSLIGPYFAGAQRAFYEDCRALYQTVIDEASK